MDFESRTSEAFDVSLDTRFRGLAAASARCVRAIAQNEKQRHAQREENNTWFPQKRGRYDRLRAKYDALKQKYIDLQEKSAMFAVQSAVAEARIKVLQKKSTGSVQVPVTDAEQTLARARETHQLLEDRAMEAEASYELILAMYKQATASWDEANAKLAMVNETAHLSQQDNTSVMKDESEGESSVCDSCSETESYLHESPTIVKLEDPDSLPKPRMAMRTRAFKRSLVQPQRT